MPTYVAFLRAINLGARRTFPMAELRDCLTEAGYADVATHIQTGNLRLSSPAPSRHEVEAELEQLFTQNRGFEVPTIALTPEELTSVYEGALVLEPVSDGHRRYVTFLKATPPVEVAAELDGWDLAGERARVVGRAVHWVVPGPTQAARLSNARIEKLLGVATTRDLKVVRMLAERWGS